MRGDNGICIPHKTLRYTLSSCEAVVLSLHVVADLESINLMQLFPALISSSPIAAERNHEQLVLEEATDASILKIEPDKLRIETEEKIAELLGQVKSLRLIEIHNDRLEREILVLRREMTRLTSQKRSTDLELLEARRLIPELERRVAGIKSTISLQLGSALVDSAQSLKAASKLPERLLEVYRSSRSLRARRTRSRANSPSHFIQSTDTIELVTKAISMAEAEGGERAAEWVRQQKPKPGAVAYALIEIAKTVCIEQPSLACSLGCEAVDLFPAEARAKLLAFQLGDRGHIRSAVSLLNKAAIGGATFNNSEARKAENLRALNRLIDSHPTIPSPRPKPVLFPSRQHIAFVATEHFDVSSAAMRLRDRAHHAMKLGHRATVIVPPNRVQASGGRPLLTTEQRSDSAGIAYVHLPALKYDEDVVDLYLSAAAESIAQTVIAQNASIVHADGFYINGVASAFAARSAGCPLIIEVNQLLDPHERLYDGFERTERGQMLLWMTVIAARAADYCIVSSENMAYTLMDGGVLRDKIVLAPHRIEAVRPTDAEMTGFQREFGLAEGPVVGVVRDLCETYDTTVLADVLAGLTAEFPNIKLVVAGHGHGKEELRKRVADYRMSDRLILIDKPQQHLFPFYRSVLDVAIFTRHNNVRAAMTSKEPLNSAIFERVLTISS